MFFSVQLSAAIVWSYGSASRRDHLSGGHSVGVPPVPIPNTAVKPDSADGSRTAGSLESRTSPDLPSAEPAGRTTERARLCGDVDERGGEGGAVLDVGHRGADRARAGAARQ